MLEQLVTLPLNAYLTLCHGIVLQVHHPVDYARVVSRIGNEMDLTLVELEDLLPAATVMVVTVTATTTSGQPLSPALLDKVIQGCAMAFQLDEDKQQVRDGLGERVGDGVLEWHVGS